MVNYDSLLLGGDECSLARKKTALKVARKVKAAKAKGTCAYGSGLAEQRLANLAKGRAVRAKNLAAKKKQQGSGQYNQDYVDESQINYAGSPLDMYYLGTQEDEAKERKERGEVGKGARRGRGAMYGCGIEEELTSRAGGKLRKQRVRSPSPSDLEEDDELEYTGRGQKGRGDSVESARQFMKHSLHTGMSRPTDAQIKRGGKVKKHTKAHSKINIEDLDGGALNVDVPDAIRVLGELASKFGLKLVQ